MQVSIKMEEVLPEIVKIVKKRLRLGKNIKLSYTSNTTFLTFEASEIKKSSGAKKWKSQIE